MTATNHTEHYGLSQYTEDDRPTYTGDYNEDMSKIDSAIYAASQAGGMTTVEHTADLTGDGTADSYLGVADTIARTEDIPSLDGYATTESVTQALAAAIADRLTAGDIKAGSGINIETSGNQVTISYVGDSSSGGLTAVAHDATLAGDGTGGSPLGVFQGGLFFNPLPTSQLDYDSIDESTIGKIYHAANGSKGTKPHANVEGICFKLRVSALAILEIVFSNDSDSNIYMRRNYHNSWAPWRTFAKISDLANYVTVNTYDTLVARVSALEQALSQSVPSTTGLTATQLDTQYSDNYNIVRVGTPTRNTESEESSHE
jgi:hypothetical protein